MRATQRIAQGKALEEQLRQIEAMRERLEGYVPAGQRPAWRHAHLATPSRTPSPPPAPRGRGRILSLLCQREVGGTPPGLFPLKAFHATHRLVRVWDPDAQREREAAIVQLLGPARCLTHRQYRHERRPEPHVPAGASLWGYPCSPTTASDAQGPAGSSGPQHSDATSPDLAALYTDRPDL